MKYLLLTIFISMLPVSLLTSCSMPPKDEPNKGTQQKKVHKRNKGLEKSLCGTWKLDRVDISLVKEENSMVETISVMHYTDTNNRKIEFYSNGAFAIENDKNGSWSVENYDLILKGSDIEGFPMELEATYRILIIDGFQLKLTKRYNDSNGNMKVSMEYVFLNNEELEKAKAYYEE